MDEEAEDNEPDGMGAAEWRASKSPASYKRGDYVPGLKVDGMDFIAVKQACKFAKEHVLENGPIKRTNFYTSHAKVCLRLLFLAKRVTTVFHFIILIRPN